MKLQKFLQYLNQNSENELVFHLGEAQLRKDYHITEVLNSNIEAVDCGGAVDSWQETILQLVGPTGNDGERFMSSSKALNIFEKSFKKIKMNKDSKLILEFKSQDSATAQRYNVENVLIENNILMVVSQGAKTQCKAAVRSNPEGKDTCGTKSEKVSCCE